MSTATKCYKTKKKSPGNIIVIEAKCDYTRKKNRILAKTYAQKLNIYKNRMHIVPTHNELQIEK